jgi:hypothetical protein
MVAPLPTSLSRGALGYPTVEVALSAALSEPGE